MALAAALAREVFATTLSYIRGRAAQWSGTDGITKLARAVFHKYGGVNSGKNYAEFRSVVNQANAAYEAAATFAPGVPAPTPPASSLIPTNGPRYEYRVLVGEGGPRGRGAETVLVIRSDEPMSYDQLRAEAVETVENMTPQPTESAGRRGIAGSTPETFVVLTASQRR